MERFRLGLRSFAFVLVACAAGVLPARAADVSLSSLEVRGNEVAPALVLDHTFDAQFLERPGGTLHVPGGPGRTWWLRIAYTVPESGGDEQGWVLAFDRVALDRISAWLPTAEGQWRQVDDGFFRAGGDSLGPNSYAFALPPGADGPQVAYASFETASRVSVTPRLLGARQFNAQDRLASGMFGAIYAAILVLMLSAAAMFVALRDRIYLHFVGFNLSLLLMLSLGNGHLYQLPGFAWAGWWGVNGMMAAALLCAAMAVAFTRHFLSAGLAPATIRYADLLRYGLFGLAALAACNFEALTSTLQRLTGLAGVLAALAIVVMSVQAWRRGERLARIYTGVWLLLGAAVVARVALAFGGLAQNALTLYVFQVTAAVCTLLMSIGLADRVMEFRRQRDRATQRQREADARLRREQVRRQLADSLSQQVRSTTPEGDIEWLAFRRLLDSLREVLPQMSAAVVANGYLGRDLMLAEPLDSKDSYQRLLAARGGSLKSLCRSRKPVQLQFDEAATAQQGDDENAPIGGLFAVVPMPVPAPGWGALLVERSVLEPFTADELKLAADFLAQAVAASDQAAQQAELQRRAELDPLTGAANRRSGQAMLDAALQRAIADRQPLSLLLIALDQLQQINERHGHALGDEFLKRFAESTRREMGRDDVLVRYNGDSFVLALPGRPPEQGRQLAERLLRAALQLRPEAGGAPVRCSLSIGVAGRQPTDDVAQGLVDRAARALEIARRHGRNQVQVAQNYGFGVPEDDAPVL